MPTSKIHPARAGRTAAKAPRPTKASAKKPVLLTGGNPQIAKADGDAPVQAYIAAMPGWKSALGRRLDALLARTVPGVRKAVRWNTPLYGIEGQGWFLGFNCLTKYVKVTLFRGTSLRPLPPGESRTAQTRSLDIFEDDPLGVKQLASWIRQAASIPGWDGGSPRLHGGLSLDREVHMKKASASPGPSAPQRISERIAELDDWRGETLARMRKLIKAADPGVVEEWKWDLPVWSHDGILCTGETYKKAVKLTFAKGVSLADPARLFNSSLEGKTRRAIDIHEGEKVDATAFKALIRAAVAFNASA